MAAIYIPHLPIGVIYLFLFMTGLGLGGQLLCYVLAVELQPKAVKGSSIAFTNFLVFLFSALLQPFIGYLLVLGWGGTMYLDAPLYTAHDFRYALTVFPATLLLSFICCFFLKEVKHKDHILPNGV